MKTKLLLLSGLAFCLSASTPAVFAADAASSQQAGDSKDMTFAKEAAIGGMFEVKAGELAEKMGESAKVKDFGAMMTKDHGNADAKLQKIAAAQKITLPSSLDEQH